MCILTLWWNSLQLTGVSVFPGQQSNHKGFATLCSWIQGTGAQDHLFIYVPHRYFKDVFHAEAARNHAVLSPQPTAFSTSATVNIHDITLVKQSLILHSTNFKASFSLARVTHTAKTLVQSTKNSQNTAEINKSHKNHRLLYQISGPKCCVQAMKTRYKLRMWLQTIWLIDTYKITVTLCVT